MRMVAGEWDRHLWMKNGYMEASPNRLRPALCKAGPMGCRPLAANYRITRCGNWRLTYGVSADWPAKELPRAVRIICRVENLRIRRRLSSRKIPARQNRRRCRYDWATADPNDYLTRCRSDR